MQGADPGFWRGGINPENAMKTKIFGQFLKKNPLNVPFGFGTDFKVQLVKMIKLQVYGKLIQNVYFIFMQPQTLMVIKF